MQQIVLTSSNLTYCVLKQKRWNKKVSFCNHLWLRQSCFFKFHRHSDQIIYPSLEVAQNYEHLLFSLYFRKTLVYWIFTQQKMKGKKRSENICIALKVIIIEDIYHKIYSETCSDTRCIHKSKKVIIMCKIMYIFSLNHHHRLLLSTPSTCNIVTAN